MQEKVALAMLRLLVVLVKMMERRETSSQIVAGT
jgi:hypothetical protein